MAQYLLMFGWLFPTRQRDKAAMNNLSFYLQTHTSLPNLIWQNQGRKTATFLVVRIAHQCQILIVHALLTICRCPLARMDGLIFPTMHSRLEEKGRQKRIQGKHVESNV
jgi:hypothetical protein